MTSTDNPFEDIEQDNNPSFYGNQSILNDPYGKNQSYQFNDSFEGSSILTTPQLPQTDLVNSQIGLSNQIHKLVNDPNLKIDIISSERLVNSSVIVYSIQLSITEDDLAIIVKRRYSEFKSIRDNLVKLYPTTIIPPIPEKHSIFTFLANSINNSNEINIIEMRKRSFKSFLNDLIFNSNPELKNSVLLHKFLDPNYELCWYNAILEPPVNLLPNSLLRANPLNPTDQNGLYSLLPMVHGYDSNSTVDNLISLRKLNDDLKGLNDQIALFELKGNDYLEIRGKGPVDPEEDGPELSNLESTNDNSEASYIISNLQVQFKEIPKNLIHFEIKFHHMIKILNDLNKLNARNTRNYKQVVGTLIELGGNLNNFSLQIYEAANVQSQPKDNSLSILIEKFGSTIDSNFLNFESFIADSLVPEWQEPIHQLIQYYVTSLSLIKFYKYKILQFKLLYKLRFNKLQELLNITLTSSSSLPLDSDASSPSLEHLKELNSPSINKAIQRMESRKKTTLSNKKSWYGLFGGNKQYPNNFQGESGAQFSNQLKFKVGQIENELNKLNQLIELSNGDLIKLTNELSLTYKTFLVELEKKWLIIMVKYIKNGKTLFNENLNNWNEFKRFLGEGESEVATQLV